MLLTVGCLGRRRMWSGRFRGGRTDVFDSEAMGTAYLFCASMNKALDRNHPAQPPAHRGLSIAEHLALVQPLLPGFHRRQQEVLQLLDREFPPDD